MNRRLFLSAGVVLCLADTAAVLLSCTIAFLLRYMTSPIMEAAPYLQTLPWLVLFPALYMGLSLYPGTFLRRPEELKRQCTATTLGFMGLAVLSFLIKESHNYSRAALLLAWVFAVFAVPLTRYLVRRYCYRFPWWSVPCVVFGNSTNLETVCAELIGAKRQGLRLAAIVLDSKDQAPDIKHLLGPSDAVIIERVPLNEPEKAKSALAELVHRYPGAYAAVSFDSSDEAKRQAWLDIIDFSFQRIIVIPNIAVGGRVWVMAVAVGRLPGLLLRQNLLDPRRMSLKRGIDLFVTLSCGVVIFPILFLLAAAVRLDSRGPAFFTHQRVGRNGRHFPVYKFRTMAVDGDAILEQHLVRDPEARKEWDATQKLKRDPRITRVGRFLRKTSLDELPQLINVLKGEMSLVGPRPIVDSEIQKYGKDFALYTRVRPGITGLWQVSGRNDVSYEERVRLDHDYVNNWSVWLDILIIARTLPEVLHCTGAY